MKKKPAKPVVKAKAVAPAKSTAQDYFCPNLFNVVTEITAIEPEFMPVYKDDVNMANVQIMAPLSHRNIQEWIINSKMVVIADTGVELVLPAGFKVRGAANLEYAKRGLFISHVFLDNKKLKFILTNIGLENPLMIPHKAFMAQIWVEPVYFFDWTN